MWRNRPASATAILKDGAVTGFTLTDPGAGYSSPPAISVQGIAGLKVEVVMIYGEDFKTNGSVKEIKVVDGGKAAR